MDIMYHCGIILYQNNESATMPIDKLVSALKNKILLTKKKLVKELKNYKLAELNSFDKTGWSPLCMAVSMKNLLAVELLLQAGVDVNLANSKGKTPFYLACSVGASEILDLLLNAKANIGTPQEFTSLFQSEIVRCGFTNVVKTLVKHNIEIEDGFVNSILKEGNDYVLVISSYISVAAMSGHFELIKYFVDELKFNLNIRASNEKVIFMSPLCAALYNNKWTKMNEDIALYLIANGADIDICNHLNMHPLLLACDLGSQKVVAALLGKGVDVNIGCLLSLPDQNTKILLTPLLNAIKNGDVNLVKFLLANGATFIKKAASAEVIEITPIEYAILQKKHEILKILLTYMSVGVDLKSNAKSPLQVAVKENNADAAKIILDAIYKQYSIEDAKAQIEYSRFSNDDSCGTALQLAAQEKNIDLVKLCINHQHQIKDLSSLGLDNFHKDYDKFLANNAHKELDPVTMANAEVRLIEKNSAYPCKDLTRSIPKKIRQQNNINGVLVFQRPPINDNVSFVLMALAVGVPYPLLSSDAQQYLANDTGKGKLDLKSVIHAGNIFISMAGKIVNDEFENIFCVSPLLKMYSEWWIKHANTFAKSQSIVDAKQRIQSFCEDSVNSKLFSKYNEANNDPMMSAAISQAERGVQDAVSINISHMFPFLSVCLFAHKDNINVSLFSYVDHLKKSSFLSYDDTTLVDIVSILKNIQKIAEFNKFVLTMMPTCLQSSAPAFTNVSKSFQNSAYAHIISDVESMIEHIAQIQYDRKIDLNAFDESKIVSIQEKHIHSNPYMYRGVMLTSSRNKRLTTPTIISTPAVHFSPDVVIAAEDKIKDEQRMKKARDLVYSYQDKLKKAAEKEKLQQKQNKSKMQHQFLAQKNQSLEIKAIVVKEVKRKKDGIDVGKFKESRELASRLAFQKITYSDPVLETAEQMQREIRKAKIAPYFERMNNIDCYLIGGEVLHLLSDYRSSDLDFVTNKMPEYSTLFTAGLKRMQFLNVPGMKFYRNYVNQIDLTVLESTQDEWLAKDSFKRDFTIAAVYLNRDGVLFAQPRAIEDIQTKTLRINGTINQFEADPIRLLRAIKYMMVGFVPDEQLQTALLTWDIHHLQDAEMHIKQHFFIKFDEYIFSYGEKYLQMLQQYGLLEKVEHIRQKNTDINTHANAFNRFFANPGLSMVAEPLQSKFAQNLSS